MAKVFDYTAPVSITITNVINPNCYKACDAGTPVQKVEVPYASIADKACAKFEYLFNADGTFKRTEDDSDYVVLVERKFKNTDREVPAYRTANSKILKAATEPNEEGKYVGDSMTFVTQNKDEVVFYEKLAILFKGELEVAIKDDVFGDVESEEATDENA